MVLRSFQPVRKMYTFHILQCNFYGPMIASHRDYYIYVCVKCVAYIVKVVASFCVALMARSQTRSSFLHEESLMYTIVISIIANNNSLLLYLY